MKNKILQILESVKNSSHREQILNKTHVLNGEFDYLIREYEDDFTPDADKVCEAFDNLSAHDRTECVIKFVGELSEEQVGTINDRFRNDRAEYRIAEVIWSK